MAYINRLFKGTGRVVLAANQTELSRLLKVKNAY
jgi:hypothetical protein